MDISTILQDMFREVVRDEVRAALREERPSEPRRLPALSTSNDVLLSTTEAADYVGVQAATIRSWITKGLPAMKAGRLIRIRKSDLNAHLAREQAKAEKFDPDAVAAALLKRGSRGRA